jgi:hypothetical protein
MLNDAVSTWSPSFNKLFLALRRPYLLTVSFAFCASAVALVAVLSMKNVWGLTKNPRFKWVRSYRMHRQIPVFGF